MGRCPRGWERKEQVSSEEGRGEEQTKVQLAKSLPCFLCLTENLLTSKMNLKFETAFFCCVCVTVTPPLLNQMQSSRATFPLNGLYLKYQVLGMSGLCHM